MLRVRPAELHSAESLQTQPRKHWKLATQAECLCFDVPSVIVQVHRAQQPFPLTPAFRPVRTQHNRDESRFNGCSWVSRVSR